MEQLLHGWQPPHNAPRSAGRRRAAARSVVSSAAGCAAGEGTGDCSKRHEYPHFNTLSLGVRSEGPDGPGCGRLPAIGGQRKGLRVFALGQRLRHFADHVTTTAGEANCARVRQWFQDKKAGWYAVLEDPQMPAMSTL